jgi:CRP/FNR family transcriptional regulator
VAAIQASNLAEAIAKLELFAGGDADMLELLASIAVRKSVAAKTVVIRQGETDAMLYGILSGTLQTSVHGPDAKDIGLSLLGAGKTVGDVSFFDRTPRSATVTAMTRAELIAFPGDRLRATLLKQPEIMLRMLGAMASMVRRLTIQMEELAALSIEVRLARKMIEIAQTHGSGLGSKQLALPPFLSQRSLAEQVQATRESVNRYLAVWKSMNIVDRAGRQFVIRDSDRLQAIADGASDKAPQV